MREYTQKEPRHTAAAFYGLLATPSIATIPPQQRARLDAVLWPRIAERARHESLRDLAAEYGVSHETIRAIVRRAGWGTGLSARRTPSPPDTMESYDATLGAPVVAAVGTVSQRLARVGPLTRATGYRGGGS